MTKNVCKEDNRQDRTVWKSTRNDGSTKYGSISFFKQEEVIDFVWIQKSDRPKNTNFLFLGK